LTVTFDTSILSAWYQAKAGLSLANGAGGAVASNAAASKTATVTPPWDARSEAPKMTDLVRSVLSGGKFVDTSASRLDSGASEDYRKLFGLYQGLTALEGLAEQIGGKGVGETEKARLRARFAEGMKEVGTFLDATTFKDFQISQGVVAPKATGAVGVKRNSDNYDTGVLHTGSPGAPVAAFQGTVKFSMTAAMPHPSTTTRTVDFDFDEMGPIPRTMSNVVLYLNGKLQAAGVSARFANVRTPGEPQTIQAGGQTISTGVTAPDSYSLQVKGVDTETVSFSAPASGPAVYLASASGQAGQSRQFVKYGTDPAAGASVAADGKVYGKALSAEISAVRQTVTGPDGSVYMLADVSSATGGQAIKGLSDVALMKYDSAGTLVYTRTLGAAKDASGYALAVSADGTRVAVAGSVTGALDLGDAGADAKSADSFVTVLDGDGQTLFTQRRGATAADQVNSVSFGADNAVYVAGTTGSAMLGGVAVGGQDSYIRGYAPAATGAAEAYTTKFTVQYGTTGTDKPSGVAVNGSTMVVAGVENGQAVLRRYDLQPTGAPVLAATRNLGPMQGSLAGVAFAADGSVIVAGTTANGALAAGAVTTAHTSGQEVFVAKLAGDLNPAGTDRLTYYGGGARSAANLSVAGGQVYVTGQIAVTPPPGQTTAFDGYAAAIDPDTGAVGWTRQFQGADRQVAPSAIAVDTSGASVLDRLGLPKGIIDSSGSPQLTAATSVRAGDQFSVRVGKGPGKTVTIEDGDTLKTLAAKIGRAIGFTAKIEVVIEKGYERLQVTPLNIRNPVEFDAGKTGRDALKSLGLAEGMAATTPNEKKGEKPNYGLQLPSSLNLDSEGWMKQAQAQLISALSTVRSIYREATAPPESTKPVIGEPSAYMSAKIANYASALARLTA
jgi:hypothetical protein